MCKYIGILGSVIYNILLNILGPPAIGLNRIHKSALLASNTGAPSRWHLSGLWEAYIWHGLVKHCVFTNVLTFVCMAA
jgi:hypothetical protein